MNDERSGSWQSLPLRLIVGAAEAVTDTLANLDLDVLNLIAKRGEEV